MANSTMKPTYAAVVRGSATPPPLQPRKPSGVAHGAATTAASVKSRDRTSAGERGPNAGGAKRRENFSDTTRQGRASNERVQVKTSRGAVSASESMTVVQAATVEPDVEGIETDASSESPEIVPLDADDSMYRGKPINSRVELENGAPASIITTRSAKKLLEKKLQAPAHPSQREIQSTKRGTKRPLSPELSDNPDIRLPPSQRARQRRSDDPSGSTALRASKQGKQAVATRGKRVMDQNSESSPQHPRHLDNHGGNDSPHRTSDAHLEDTAPEDPEDTRIQLDDMEIESPDRDLDEEGRDEYDLTDPFINDGEVEYADDEDGSDSSRVARRGMDGHELSFMGEMEDDQDDEHGAQDVVHDGGTPLATIKTKNKRLRFKNADGSDVEGDGFEETTAREDPGTTSAHLSQDIAQDTPPNLPSPTPLRPTFGSVLGVAGGASERPSSAVSRGQSSGAGADPSFRQVVQSDLPEKCHVFCRGMQDELLRDTYVGLPKLHEGRFVSWSDAEGPGMVWFSKWGDTCPSMGYNGCFDAMTFVKHKHYLNPARASPLDVAVYRFEAPRASGASKALESRPRYILYTLDRRPAVCVSSVLSVESHVLEPPERGLKQKWLSGIHHTQEYERMVGFMGTVFRQDSFRSQMSMDAIQYTTRAVFGNNSDRKGSTPPKKLSAMFSNMRSPAVSSQPNVVKARTGEAVSLEFDAEIPVYDCREIDLRLTRELDTLDTLPRWKSEIPYGSFVVVGYTVTVFQAEKTNAWTISFNIQWAMLLGLAECD